MPLVKKPVTACDSHLLSDRIERWGLNTKRWEEISIPKDIFEMFIIIAKRGEKKKNEFLDLLLNEIHSKGTVNKFDTSEIYFYVFASGWIKATFYQLIQHIEKISESLF